MDAEYDDNEITVVKEIPMPPPSPPRDQFGRVRREGVDLGPQQTTVSQAPQSNYGLSNQGKPYGETGGSWQQQQASPAASVAAGGWQQQQSSGWQQQGSVGMAGWQQQPSAPLAPKFPQNPILGPARSEGWVGERQRCLNSITSLDS